MNVAVLGAGAGRRPGQVLHENGNGVTLWTSRRHPWANSGQGRSDRTCPECRLPTDWKVGRGFREGRRRTRVAW